MENKKLQSIVKEAKEFCIINACEVFVYSDDNGDYSFSNLQTLNYIVNELKENIRILYNIYQDSIIVRINPFCEPIVSQQF